MNPKIKILGLTATPYRLDSGYLHEGKDALFDGVAYEIEVAQLIEEGYLCPIISKGGVKSIDLTNVKKRGGEYIESDLAKAASEPELVKAVISEILYYGASRKCGMVFASGMSHAEMLRDEFIAQGETSIDVLTGTTPRKDRDAIIERHKSGALKYLINIGVLTTGYNNKMVDLIAMVTATESTSKYVQIAGRGMRVHHNKTDCLFLDYGQNVVRHGTIDNVTPVIKSSNGDGEAPAKECPECHTHLHAASRECVSCGYVFPEPELKHDTRAYNGAMLSSQIQPVTMPVDRVTYTRHKKNGSPDSVRVTYWSGLTITQEWLCFEHEGYARNKAIKESEKLGAKATTTDEALAVCESWKQPIEITVKPDGKYTKIVSKRYE